MLKGTYPPELFVKLEGPEDLQPEKLSLSIASSLYQEPVCREDLARPLEEPVFIVPEVRMGTGLQHPKGPKACKPFLGGLKVLSVKGLVGCRTRIS